ncbi:unannotated protein [freshwater metagenome]|uniref:Unannotated protein n=1 Tax=freshwater metagenome TaxID=449393 RepID=A0A6J6MVR4_9ZZZZ
MCSDGIAAYWFVSLLPGPLSNAQGPPNSLIVSTKPKFSAPLRVRNSLTMHLAPNPASGHGASSNRGGINGNNEKPMIASAVITARVFRHCPKTDGRNLYNAMKTPSVTKK